MKSKDLARIEMSVILSERQAYLEQGLMPQAPSLEQSAHRLPAMAAELLQLESMIDLFEQSPEALESWSQMVEQQMAAAA